ncbi:PSD1 and planctomycete cytochrome C domain-containing protein [Roseibacillus ishigakijimensis]|uniref:PSD1 domain-containing protein n=1 Tax=Roseibacillus ishigakijimensis TaxID=454146 RepID=A0A934VK41_9BACT|nr:PSD1 and planctomycete cytochrome C domain-containing protein [Roseibacillus ishigakijimensis]MBK1833254.1 PSD1 domain-containing protein [Roseibacillus ishigakijimensis]
MKIISSIALWGTLTLPSPARSGSTADSHFVETVLPILQTACYDCHSHVGEEARGGLVVDSRAALLKGGDSGPAIVPGDPAASGLIRAISRQDPDTQMPPKDSAALSPEEIAHLSRWIEEGAPWPESARTAPDPLSEAEKGAEHWSYQPLAKVAVPRVKSPQWQDWAQNEIDHFIASRLEEETVSPGPPADGRTLARRLSFGLTGLPPQSQEIALAEEGKITELVDRYLASPEYGRKWGRHWLDVARYSDTAGDNSDFPIPQMSLYRDYVIRSFNEDLPFDEFIKEQLAGDLMDSQGDEEVYRRRIIATSFVANSVRFCDDLKNDLPLVISDSIDAMGQAFLGMQMSCAKCHNHKFDPIPASDYYGLYGYFSSTRYPYAGREGRQVPFNLVATTPDPAINAKVEEVNRSVKERILESGRIKLTQGVGAEIVADLKAQHALSELAFAVKDSGQGHDAPIHLKGNHKRKGPIVPRGFLSVIAGEEKPEIPEGESGRLQLAEWIASDENPLTARVIVNRVWGWHFGRALAETPNNVGMSGALPTHPELLDYLAGRFIASGWSLKELSRLILSSATYQQAWRPDSQGPVSDTSNKLWWRFDRRRLTAEELRDAALTAAGLLDLANPGPHPFPGLGEANYTQHKPYEGTFQHNFRSVFLMTSRIRQQEFLSLFDGADPTNSTGQRRTSTVPVQALYLLNNPRMHEFADAFAERLLSSAREAEDRLAAAFAIAYQRPPAKEERELIFQHFPEHADTSNEAVAWQTLAQALLLSNEFAYLE